MTISQTVYNDLFKRIEKMSLSECKRIEADMPSELSSVDEAILSMIRERIEQLRQGGVEECD